MIRHLTTPSFCEGVTDGHPDKLADLISDAVLDSYLEKDPEAHVGVETILSKDLICITGEVESSGHPDIVSTIRSVLSQTLPRTLQSFPEIGKIPLQIHIHHQSKELAKVVNETQDQAIITGYATKETPERMPLSFMWARRLLNYIEERKKKESLPFLKEDGKVMVAVDRATKRPVKILASYQHEAAMELREMRQAFEQVLKNWAPTDCALLINPLGPFIEGSLLADTGVSGRKLIYNTYGSEIPHGGGSMSGKDPRKVDRWGALLARKMALEALETYDLDQVLVRLAFHPGTGPLFGLSVDTFGKVPPTVEKEIVLFLMHNFPLDTQGTVKLFRLDKPLYYEKTKEGTFGNPAPWDISG